MATTTPPAGYTTNASGQFVPISTTGPTGLNPTATQAPINQFEGLTQVPNPAALTGLTEQQIVRDPNSDAIFYAQGSEPTGLQNIVERAPDEIRPDQGVSSQLDGTTSGAFDYTRNVAQESMTEFEKAILDLQQQRFQVDEDTRAREQKEADDARLGLEQALDRPSELELFKQFEESAGIKEQEEALSEIMSQINSIQGAAQAELNLISGSPFSTQFIMGRNRKISDKANADITALSAAGDLVQNKIDSANKKIGNYYNLAIRDRENEIERRQTLYELEANDVIKLDEKEREANDAQITLLQEMNQRQLAEQDDIKNIMLNNPLAWKSSGASLNMPLDEVLERVTSFSAQQQQFDAARTGPSGPVSKPFSFATADRDRLLATGLSVIDIQNIEDRISAGESITDITGEIGITESQETTLKNSLSGITALQEAKAGEPEKTTKDQRLAVALDSALTDFTDKLGGWGVPQEFQTTFGLEAKINDEELANFLSVQFQINITEAEKIVEQAEKGSGFSK